MLLQGRLLIDPALRPQPGWLRIEGERIAEIGEGDPPARPHAGDRGTLLTPGFVDAHLHLPQFPVIGCDGMTLLDWLERIVFPAEATWADRATAERAAREAVRRLLHSGTLAFAAFLTSHATALPAAAAALHNVPLSALVGRVLMDRGAPGDLLSAAGPGFFAAPAEAPPRLRTAVTPRFALCCSDRALHFAGEQARSAFVQTHLAETTAEVERVRILFPEQPSYTAVYDAFGLLHARTLLAHCLHLSDEEWDLIAKRNCIVVHCPQANTFLQSGLFDLDAVEERGIRLALGSDIGAGCDVAMPRVARAMLEMAKLRRATVAPRARVPTAAQAWSLITRGGAEALGLGDGGRLAAGAAADLLLLRPPFDLDEHLIGRLIHTWDDGYIAGRIVAGQLIQ